MPPFIWVRTNGLGQTLFKSQETGRWWRSGRRAIEPIFLPRGLHTSKKPPEKASGWYLRVLGRYESSLICANLNVGRKRYKAIEIQPPVGYNCKGLRSSSLPTLVLAETAHACCLMDSRPIKFD